MPKQHPTAAATKVTPFKTTTTHINTGNGSSSSTSSSVVDKSAASPPMSFSSSSSSSGMHSGDAADACNGGGAAEQEFKPVTTTAPSLSCANCRKLHRKCDKKQPKCSQCVTYHRECKYTPGVNKQYIRKKKKPPGAAGDEMTNNTQHGGSYFMVQLNHQNSMPRTPTPQIEFSETFLKNCVKKQTLDVYYRKLSMGMSIIQQTRMEELFFGNKMIEQQELDQNDYTLSLFYSIQALCDQYMGRREKAYEAYNNCKKYLGKVYDDFESFAVICTFNYVAFFLAGEGEDELSHNYLALVDQYFTRRKKKLALGIPCFPGNTETTHYIVNNLDKKRGVTRIFFFDNRLEWKSSQKYSDLLGVAYKISTGDELLQHYVQLLDSDLNEHTYDQQMEVLHEIHLLMKKSHQGRIHVPEYVQIGLMMDKLNLGLHKLEALRVVLSKNPVNRLGVKLELLKQADAISELVDNVYFQGMLSSFIFGFAVASQVHFELLFDSDIYHHSDYNSKNHHGGSNDGGGMAIRLKILNSLKRDLRGLKLFASKYGRTTKVYGHIIDAVETLLGNISPHLNDSPAAGSRTMNENTTTSNCGMIEETQSIYWWRLK